MWFSPAVVGANGHHHEVRTFNIINYHKDDGVSLNAFVDWIESAGYGIIRIEDHANWYRRMQQKLTDLSDHQRRLSAIDVLMAFGHPLSFANTHGRV